MNDTPMLPPIDDFDRASLEMLGVDLTGPIPGSQETALYGGGYDGADPFDRQFVLWQPFNRSADGDVIPDKYAATARARDLRRNDAYVAHGTNFHRDAVVGSRFRLQAKPNYEQLGLTEEWAKEFSKEVEARWEAYSEGDGRWLDAARRNTFTGLVRLAIANYIDHQEILASVEWMREGGRPGRTAINLIDPDRLLTPYAFGGGIRGLFVQNQKTRGGIERNRFGRPIAYHIHEGYPHEALFSANNRRTRRVLAEKPWGRRQIIHIMEQQRIAQTRGISQIVTALKQSKMAHKYREVVLQNAVLNASIAATIESELPTEQLFQMLGSGGNVDPVEKYLGFAGKTLAAQGKFGKGSKNLTVDGAKIPHLWPGSKLKLLNAGSPGGVGDDFEISLLRNLAASLDMTYEELAGDLRNTNYSSIRAGMNMTRRAMQARKAMVADQFATQCYIVWLEEELNNGRIKAMAQARNAPNFYEGLNKEWYSRCDWLGSGSAQVDELKETQAAILRIEKGLSTYEIEIGKLHGTDYREHFHQIAKERGLLGELDIEFGESNAINAASGRVGPANTDTGNTESNGDVPDE